jgi:c-di-GMP-binding flagellar brake protein YcgR
MRATGPAEHSQRRKAVRGRVVVPIEAKCAGVQLKGTTVDLSEAGVRANFDGFGVPPEQGNTLDLVIRLEEGPITAKAEVVRNQARGAVWLMSIRFNSIEERDQDKIRRRVFQALREERAKMADDAPRDLRG